MEKYLSICVLSHDRPNQLKLMLGSLKKVNLDQRIEIIVSDNSTKFFEEIKEICLINKIDKFKQQKGVSEYQNFLNSYYLSTAKYISFFHDDDTFYISNPEYEELINNLQNKDIKRMLFFNSISFSPDKPYICQNPNKDIPKPYSLKSFPFELPVFPCWIYPRNIFLLDALNKNINNSFCGKHSDITLVEDLLEKYDYRCSNVPGLYIHNMSEISASSKIDYLDKLNLCIHIIKKTKKILLLYLITRFLIATLNSIIKKSIK